jgi:hypothetical protein
MNGFKIYFRLIAFAQSQIVFLPKEKLQVEKLELSSIGISVLACVFRIDDW